MEQEAAKLDVFGVQRQLRESNCELAAVNLSRESELGELRNQIAIVRCSKCFANATPLKHRRLRSSHCNDKQLDN